MRGLRFTIAVLAVLPACTASSPAPPGPPSRPTVVPDAVREATNPDPNFDYGFTVQITPAGLRPHWVVANCCQPITWKNQTTATTSVVFDHLEGGSGPIPAGGTFVYTPPHVESIAYHLGNDPSRRGVVQVNQTAE